VSALIATPPQHPSPERRATNSLPSALLLAFTGGVLDAFLYIAHGEVFAGAMTGNAVLTGIALLSHDRQNALHHLLPIVSFLVGIWLAFAVESRMKRHAAVAGLLFEGLGLFVLSWLPGGYPDALFIVSISGLAGYQIASFRRVDSYSYNATFITANLRTVVEASHNALIPAQRRESLRRLRDLGLVVILFIAGVFIGALLTSRLGNHALWAAVIPLAVVLALALDRDLRAARSQQRGSRL
jgi:uncharacterized membrane protein YoaK (UPF0700 family)